jgi:SPP1 gp7 family putative phage head morphogenesis protein
MKDLFATVQAKFSLLVASAIQTSWLGGVLSTKAPDTSPPSVADASATPPGQGDQTPDRKIAVAPPKPLENKGLLIPGGSEPPPEEPIDALWPEGEPPFEVRLPILEEAAERVRTARTMSIEEFHLLGENSRQAGFAITSDMGLESVAKIQSLLAENLASGADREAFLEEVDQAFEGGMPISEAHLEMVFRNTTNTAWSDGAEASLAHELVVDEFPYRQYFATTDERVRKEHFALESIGLNGTGIYRADDPVWQLFRPPWSWNCRCSWAPLNVTMAARAGVREAKQWQADAMEHKRLTGDAMQRALSITAPNEPEHVPMPEFQPDPQWIRSLHVG